MKMEETLVFLMSQFIAEMEMPDKKKKSDLALNIIGLLFIYLRNLGLSDGEMIRYYEKYNWNPKEDVNNGAI